jgi:RNA polymerase sigma-70 factor (ECF subfamily)
MPTLTIPEQHDALTVSEQLAGRAIVRDAERRIDAREIEALMRDDGRAIHRFLALKGVMSRDVPDVAQHVFFLAHRKWADFRGEASRRAWLFGIARNCAADYRKQRDRQLAAHESYGVYMESAPRSARGPDEQTQASDDLRILYMILNELKEQVRNVFVLYEIDGLTMAEIAAIEGIPEQTGYSRLKVARDAVLRRFAEIEGGKP